MSLETWIIVTIAALLLLYLTYALLKPEKF
jgi:K+-transporting ATPase KdpF subunit